jgi:molybdopterin-guanine dinucleotide biosynthesis protein A
MKKADTAIILAGGKSLRMGFDKKYIKVGNQFLIDILINKLKKIFDEIIVVSNDKKVYKNDGVIVVEDEIKNIGPLGGLHIGLKHSSSNYSYVIACDMPYINEAYIEFMKTKLELKDDVYAVITRYKEHIEPFNSFYSKKMTEEIKKHICTQKRSIFSLLKKLEVIYIEEVMARYFSPDWQMFKNLNTRKELEKFYLKNNEGRVL